jgi:hypothetical protein
MKLIRCIYRRRSRQRYQQHKSHLNHFIVATYIGKKIIGTWKLVSWIYKGRQGEDLHYFGENAAGILMYDINGYMNAQLMKAGRPPFSSSSIDGSTPQEAFGAFNSYIAYYGKYLEEKPGEITHIVEGSLFPNWMGNKQVRYGRIENDHLILHTPPMRVAGNDIVFYITWKRVLTAKSKN